MFRAKINKFFDIVQKSYFVKQHIVWKVDSSNRFRHFENFLIGFALTYLQIIKSSKDWITLNNLTQGKPSKVEHHFTTLVIYMH